MGRKRNYEKAKVELDRYEKKKSVVVAKAPQRKILDILNVEIAGLYRMRKESEKKIYSLTFELEKVKKQNQNIVETIEIKVNQRNHALELEREKKDGRK